MSARPLLAIFVGGQSRRMGQHKGLLTAPNEPAPIVEVLVHRGRFAKLDPILVGNAAPYRGLAHGVPRVDDDPPGAGPLAGLHASLRYALSEGRASVIAIGCDMPYVTVEALAQLRDHPSDAPVIAPRRGPRAPWEPMLARYDAIRLADSVAEIIAQGERSFQAFFSSVDVEPLALCDAVERALNDWDTPDDVAR